MTVEIAKRLNDEHVRGVLVTDVERGSPAERGYIRVGDIIMEINKGPVWDIQAFKEEVSRADLKQRVVLLIRRQNVTYYAVLGEPPN